MVMLNGLGPRPTQSTYSTPDIDTQAAVRAKIDKNPMGYRPGSFSKNFAWHGTGLRKLHQAIREGFRSEAHPVTRESWRRACGIGDDDLELIPLNFFLHNSVIDGTNYVSVDELVLQAISSPHSAVFDQLALFALNLSRAGVRKGAHSGEARPAGWASDFVRKQLWKGGAWRKEALDKAHMDAFLEGQLDAQQRSRKKVRTNYRHIFELCGYLSGHSGTIETNPTSWGVSAAYLLWDRLTLDGELSPTASIDILKRDALRAEFHKLLGTSEAKARQILEVAAPLYIEMRRLARTSHAPPQFHRVAAKIEAGATSRYGDAAERAQRVAILNRIAALERELERMRPAHGGIGHNNPPSDESIGDEAREAVGALKDELKREKPHAAVVAGKTSRLQAIIGWCGDKADKFVDSFVQTLGKTSAEAVVLLWPIADQLRSLVTMLTRWLSMIVGIP
jgi:hypothetical protein